MQPNPVAAIPGLRRKRGSISISAISLLKCIDCTTSKGTKRNTKSAWIVLFPQGSEILAKAPAPPRPQGLSQKPTNFFRFQPFSSTTFSLRCNPGSLLCLSDLEKASYATRYCQPFFDSDAACCCRQSYVDAKNPGQGYQQVVHQMSNMF
jgi:hypothetical protein